MAIGRISGQMLKANLLRSGTDLAFETNLLVLDVTNSFVGIGTATPARKLHISDTGALRLPSGSDAQRGTAANGDIRYNSDRNSIEGYVNGIWTNLGSGSQLLDTDGNTGIDVERSTDENQIHFFIESVGDVAHIRSDGAIELNNLEIDNQTITGLSTNTDINITPNGTGNVNLNADTIRVGDSSGDITITTNDAVDLVLSTNNGTNSGTIKIQDGASSDIDITPNGTGEVNITKVDIDAGAIDGTTIGANSAAAGTFTNLTANGTINIDGDGSGDNIDGVIIGANLAAAGKFTTIVVNELSSDDSTAIQINEALNVSGAVTASAFDARDGNITNVGDIALDSISADNGTDFDITLADNQANALEIKEAGNSYLNFATTNGSELITAGQPFTVASTKTFTTDTADINGGAIDGTTIGANSAAAGTFTNLTANGTIHIDGDGSGDNIDGVIIGANLAAAGTFTTVDTSGNVTVGGNLIVNGVTTTIESTTLQIEDPLLTLAKNNSGGTANTYDQGLLINRGSDTNQFIGWDESEDEFAVFSTSDTGSTAGNINLTAYSDFAAKDVYANSLVTDGITIEDNNITATQSNDNLVLTPSGTGSVVINGTTTFGGTVSFGDNNITNVGDINVDSVSSDNGTDFDILLDDNSATALEIKEGSTAYMTFVTTDAGEQITVDKKLLVSSGVTFQSDTVDINGGAIDGTTIGANSAAAGTFTNVVLNELSSADSSAIQINDGVNISGTLNAKTLVTNDISSEDSTTIQINDSLNVSGTLTAKTLDVNELFSSDSSAIQISDGLNVSGTTTANTFLSSNATLTGGTIDNMVIGGTTRAAGSFTTVDANDNITISADNKALQIGAGTDFTITHDGTNTQITNSTGILKIDGAATSAIRINEAGADVDVVIEGDSDTDLLYIDASADKIGISTATPAYILDIDSTDAVRLPQGSNSTRPTAATGVIRFNTDSSSYEGSTDGSTWTTFAMGGGGVAAISKVSATGDGSTTTFTGFFADSPATAANVLVFIDNVHQEPTENYTVSSNNITFTSAPHSGARIYALVGFDAGSMTTGGVARTQTDSVSFTSSATAIMTYNATSYRSAELFITITDAGNTEYSCMKANVVHDGTTAYITVYGIVNTGASDAATITASLASSTVTVSAVSTGGASSALVQYSLQAV